MKKLWILGMLALLLSFAAFSTDPPGVVFIGPNGSVNPGVAKAMSQVVLDANGHVDTMKIANLYIGESGAETQVTATAAELNHLDGITSSYAELNILDGCTATYQELNYLDLTGGPGVAQASKAMVLDTNAHIDAVKTAALSIGASGSETAVDSTAAELNYNHSVTPGTASASKTVILDANKGISGLGNVGVSGADKDVTLSPDSSGGNAGAKNEYSGLPRIKLVGIGTMANGTTNTVITDIGDSETPATDWTAIDGDTVMSNDTTYYRQGTASLKMAVAQTATAGDGCTNALGSGDQDWTDDEAFGCWIYSDTALASGDLVLRIADATAAGGYTDVNFPAVTANSWQWAELDVTLGNNNLKDVITDLSIVLSSAGEAKAAAAAFNVYFDFFVKWDVAEEETLGAGIIQDGVLSVTVVDATDSGATSANLAEYTDYFVHYQSGNDAIVIMTDQSGADKVGLALIAY